MTIQLRFQQFHDANPQVYEAFKKVAFNAVARGKTRVSAKFVFELLRWEGRIPTATAGSPKFNNDFTSRYSRMFAAEYPMHVDLFETREIITA